jgi:nucleoside-diphosphate-sugar epimerase
MSVLNLNILKLFHITAAEILILIPFFQVRIARIFNTYGPRMCIDDGRVVSNFVAQVN